MRYTLSNDQVVRDSGKWPYDKGVKSMLIIGPDIAAGREIIGSVKKGFVDGGGKVAGEIYTPLNVRDRGPYLAQIRSTNPEVIYAFKPLFDESVVPEPFEMVLASDGRVVSVAAEESALDALRRHGVTLPSACEVGVCGSCECGYSAGDVIHRDSFLNPTVRRTRFTPCVSRAGGRLVVDL
jgi:ferredoxin